MDRQYDPQELGHTVRQIVVRGGLRKYYRTSRPGRWYGGISTADCVGCNLKCVFCWSNKPRDNPQTVGIFHSAEQIYECLTRCASKYGYRLLRVSGNEPIIAKEHILELLTLVDRSHYRFILETNGILIDEEFAKLLRSFRNLQVRVSLKGTTCAEFSQLTGAEQAAFNCQLDALRNLVAYSVRCSVAVMVSFSPQESVEQLKLSIEKIDPLLASSIEEEYLILYPHVIKRLEAAELKPLVAFTPDGIPKRLKEW